MGERLTLEAVLGKIQDLDKGKKQIRGFVDQSNKILSSLSLGGFTVSLATVGAGIAAGFREAANEQRDYLSLQAALASTGNLTAETYERLLAAIDGADAALDGFTDSQFIQATEAIVRHTGEATVSTQELISIADLAVAKFNGDVVAAADRHARARLGETEALGDLFPELRRYIREGTLVTGTTEAAAFAAEFLEERVGGTAKTLEQNVNVQLRETRKLLEEMAVGTVQATGGPDSLAGSLAAVNDELEDLIDNIPQTVAFFSTIKEVLSFGASRLVDDLAGVAEFFQIDAGDLQEYLRTRFPLPDLGVGDFVSDVYFQELERARQNLDRSRRPGGGGSGRDSSPLGSGTDRGRTFAQDFLAEFGVELRSFQSVVASGDEYTFVPQVSLRDSAGVSLRDQLRGAAEEAERLVELLDQPFQRAETGLSPETLANIRGTSEGLQSVGGELRNTISSAIGAGFADGERFVDGFISSIADSAKRQFADIAATAGINLVAGALGFGPIAGAASFFGAEIGGGGAAQSVQGGVARANATAASWKHLRS